MDSARISGPSNIPLADYSPSKRPTTPSRRSSLTSVVDDASGPIWRALDLAAGHVVYKAAEKQFNGRPDLVVDRIAAATSAIREFVRRPQQVMAGELPVIDREIVGALRSEFLDQLRSDVPSDAARLHRVMLAFEALERTASEADARSMTGGGLQALVEVAHDMRSPLTSILFLVEAMRGERSGPITTLQERQLGLIYGAALGLSTLASDLIDHVRGGAGLVDGAAAPFSITEVLLGVLAIVTPIAEEKGLELDWTLSAVDGRIGYSGALGRVLLNLATNAVKYTETGSVRIACSPCGASGVLFSVEDTGSGIPDDVQNSLFSPFRKVGGKMSFSNSGLGLSICRTLLSSMGSELHVEPGSKRGTRLWFKLNLPSADRSAPTLLR